MTDHPSDDGVLRISFNAKAGPPTVDSDAMRGCIDAIQAAGSNVGAILISHSGSNFCLGGSVTDFVAGSDPGEVIPRVAAVLHETMRCLVSTPLPVVAAVQGWAAGAGMSIVAAADIAVAGRSTRFRTAYTAVGLSPDGGMSWTLPRSIGRARAADLLLTNRAVDAPEALSIGLVSRVVDDDMVQAEAEAIAAKLARGSSSSLGGIKKLLTLSATSDFSGQLDAELATMSAQAISADGLEGLTAFVEGRPPVFRGK